MEKDTVPEVEEERYGSKATFFHVETQEISKLFRSELSRRCNRAERTRRRHATLTAPFSLHVIDVGLLRTGCVIRGVGQDAPQWDVCKSPGFPSNCNRVAAGQVYPPAVRITMVCSLFACRLSASEAFLFLSGAVCWVFSNAYTKEEHSAGFFVAGDR